MNDLGRSQALSQLTGEVLDVLIIGGGIVGAGVARDAAMRGLRVGLIDQADFASGTSSRSSRLLHGGIRYLAQGRVKLVREASREKTVLARIAPHLAQPLPFLFPTRKGTPWSKWKLSIGVKLYDLLCGMKNFGRSSALNVEGTKSLLLGISGEALTGAVRYFDALTNDARLVIDTLRSAENSGARLANYVQFADATHCGGLWNCELHDQATNEIPLPSREGLGEGHFGVGIDVDASKTPPLAPPRSTGEGDFLVQARTVVNAAGPWSDKIPHSKTKLRLTKGVHLVVDRGRFPIPEAVVMAQGDRIMFAIPWGERVILGTTDTDYEGDLANPPCDAADIAQVLSVVNETFPESRLSADDVISTWSGLRPLVADSRGRPSDISRRHEIQMTHRGWWDITGGKLTTYRLMAEEAVDQIVRFLNTKSKSCQTATEPLVEFAGNNSISGILPPEVSKHAVLVACREEWARHLDDVMIRRTNWRYYHREQQAIAEQVADWMAAELGWDEATTHKELKRYGGL